MPAEIVASNGSTLGCSSFPAGSMNGKIALIERGICEFSTKVLNAQNADGSIAATVTSGAAVPGLMLMHRIDVPDGATANIDTALTYKERVIDAWLVR